MQDEVKVAVVLKCITEQLRTSANLQLSEGMTCMELLEALLKYGPNNVGHTLFRRPKIQRWRLTGRRAKEKARKVARMPKQKERRAKMRKETQQENLALGSQEKARMAGQEGREQGQAVSEL